MAAIASSSNSSDDAGGGIYSHHGTVRTAAGLGVMNVDAIVVRNISGDHVELAGYLNCPQNLKWVGAQGNCTALVLDNIQFPGMTPWHASITNK
jgi:hypothetical protein